FHEVRFVAHALEVLLQFVPGNAGEKAGVGNLVSIEMKDRKHTAVSSRIEEFVAVPAGSEGPGLRFAVADNAGNDQVPIVERGPIGVAEGIPELATLMNAAWRFWSDMAGDTAWEAELLEQFLHPLRVLTDVRIDLAVGALQIGMRDQRG